MKINGNPADKLSAEQQSNKLEEVQTNNDESPKRSKKRKSFPKKKRKRTKEQKMKTKKHGKLIQHRHQAEDFILGSGENNYSTAANNCKKKSNFDQLFSIHFNQDLKL